MRQLSLLLVFVVVCGCGGDDAASAARATLRMVPNVIAGAQTASSKSSGVAAQASALRIGTVTATDLLSLKYFVIGIQLCQNVALMGSGFSSTEGCIALYQSEMSAAPNYDEYLVTQAKDDTTEGRYTDLMSAEGQAALRRPVSLEVRVADPNRPDAGSAPSQAGVYRFGLINFYRPIKLSARFPLLGHSEQYFRTRAVTAIHTERTDDGRHDNERVEIGDTLSGPVEETTYMLSNGGALFTFQKPFVISQADIDNREEIKIDLVFNPDSFGQAHDSDNCASDRHAAICDPTNNVSIEMPFVRMSPVPRKRGEHTHKETYLLDYDSSAKLRIELYYNDGDEEAGIQGVDTAIVYSPTATMPTNNMVASNFASQRGSVRSSDAAVTLEDYQHTPSLEGLVRRQDGSALVHCLYTGGLCPSVGTTIERAYHYLGDSVVSAD